MTLPILPAPGGKLVEGPIIPVRVGVLVISDTRDEETDTTGPLLMNRIQEAGFEIIIQQTRSQLDGACGVLNDLDSFDSGNLVEEPATAGIHQHQVALQLEQLEASNGFHRRKPAAGLRRHEANDIFK